MTEIVLYARGNGRWPMGKDAVTTVQVPPMDPPPEVIVWGDRLFVRTLMANHSYRYIEGIAWVVPVVATEGE